jgi:hypothetical protein
LEVLRSGSSALFDGVLYGEQLRDFGSTAVSSALFDGVLCGEQLREFGSTAVREFGFI